MQNSAAFQTKYVFRDFQAGIITGTMAIPLTVGIALMSNYPIKVALATVVFACFIGWINAWFKQFWRWVSRILAWRIWRSSFS